MRAKPLICLPAGITWVFTATYLGLPVSTSQSMTGGVIGTGTAMIIVLVKSVELNTRVIVDIIVNWTLSPTLALFPDDATLYVS
jgi:phosphate/sulfate permease